MFTILEGSAGNVLAVAITGGYTQADFEAFRQAFEAVLTQGHAQVNVLCRIDELSLLESEWRAFIADARYALAKRDRLRHIAIVADSTVLGWLVKLDNLILGDPGRELVERSFDVKDLDQAWAFVRQ